MAATYNIEIIKNLFLVKMLMNNAKNLLLHLKFLLWYCGIKAIDIALWNNSTVI